MNRLYHAELGGNYTMKRKIIVDATEIYPEEIEIMTYRCGNVLTDDEELECVKAKTPEEAEKIFNEMLSHYLEPLQKAVFDAGLIKGEKYTLFYLNDFGFPVSEKIVFLDYEFMTYAQHSDVVKIKFKPYRKKNIYSMRFYNMSIALFKGWQDFNKESAVDVLQDDGNVKITKSKYECFDARYFDDGIKQFKNPVMIYRDYKTGVNGKIYA